MNNGVFSVFGRNRFNVTEGLGKHIKATLIAALTMAAAAATAADGYNSTNRVPAGIYLMWITDGSSDAFNKPWYVGQARRAGKTVDEMVEARVNEHLSEKKFKDLLGPGQSWAYDIRVRSDKAPTEDAAGWTSLETGLNEQAVLTGYCDETAITANPRMLNSRNQASQTDVTNYWVVSASKLTNLVASAKNPMGTAAKAVTNGTGCFTK